jgi:hypothetical protein
MNTTRVMSLVAATVFALGVAGPAVAQTPATPTPAPAQPAAPAKGGDMQMEKKDKKDGKAADKTTAKKKHAAKKATEGDMKPAPETKAPEVKK